MVVHTCVDSVIESLCALVELMLGSGKGQVHTLEVELRFIRMFLWCSVSCDSDADFGCILTSIQSIWKPDRTLEDLHKLARLTWRKRRETPQEEFQKVIDKLGEKSLLSKQEIKKHSYQSISKSLVCKPLSIHEMQQFLDAIINNMDRVVNYRENDVIMPLKNQLDTLQKKLLMFRNLVEFTSTLCLLDCKALDDFHIHVLTCASTTLLCLTFLFLEDGEHEKSSEDVRSHSYWCGFLTCGLVGKHESKMNKTNYLVTDLMQKVYPKTPEFIDMCFALIKLTKSSSLDILLFEELVSDFVDFLLQNMMLTPQDGLDMLREGLIYLITFFACSPANYAEDNELISIHNQIDAVLSEASRLIFLFCEAKVDFSTGKIVLAQLLNIIDQVRGKIDKHCVLIPLSRWSGFPHIDGLGFVENLVVYLEDLQEAMGSHPKLVPSLKSQILTIKDELTSLRPFLQDISKSLNEHNKLKDIWEEIISVSYLAELAIKQSLFTDHHLCLSYVLRKFQDIQSKVFMRVKDSHIYTAGIIPSLTNSANMPRISVSTLGDDGEVVGFKQETERISDQLLRGTKELDIVSIVGMGGIGKTTLAKKVYKKTSVSYYFHKRAFCTVSQEYRSKNMLLEILRHFIGINDTMCNMTEEDLGDMLRKALLGHRYLIVLDDIWDVKAWHRVKNSFPDEKNGSRVLFTTRNSSVPLKAKPNCSLEQLRFLTIDESWDLLERKIFQKNACPHYLFEVGRSISENCKGLPLSVVVIAGLLAKCERSVPKWQEVADNVTSYASSERCGGILELSYKHMSEALKSCFLYLRGFPEDAEYRARDITKLWAAEGFVPRSDRSCVHKVAKGYLNHLGDRSLLIVTERSLAGNIKRFRLHNVIREFCTSKVLEEQLICLVNGHNDNLSMRLTYDGYRICVQAETGSFIDANPRGPAVHSLLSFNYVYPRYKCFTSSLFRNFTLTEVLDLLPVEFQDFPTAITMLVHLRYLAVRYVVCLGDSFVPPTIAKLRNLETLIVRVSELLYLPDTIWKMKRLRHMEFRGGCSFDGLNSVACEALPQLFDLERLSWVLIGDKEEGEELLRRLPNVRKLDCNCEGIPEQLFNLSKIESLRIISTNREKSSLSLPSTLKKLSLTGFQIPDRESFSMIAKLPCLQVLVLTDCRFPGDRWDMEDDEFINLKQLEFFDLQIKHWEATTDSFPCLEKLELNGCTELVGIPLCFGEVPTLRALEVKYCNEGVESSAIEIQKEQLNSGNDFQIFSLSAEEPTLS